MKIPVVVRRIVPNRVREQRLDSVRRRDRLVRLLASELGVTPAEASRLADLVIDAWDEPRPLS